MGRPIWFRLNLSRRGWSPCAWQGWVVIGIFVGALALATMDWAASAPWRVVVAGSVLAALLVGTAALTSGSAKTGE